MGLVALSLVGYGVTTHYYIEGYCYGYGFFISAMAYHLALWSYSIYLVHKPVGFVIRQQMQELAPSMMLLTIVAVSLALGAALYYLVELPFMRLRDARCPLPASDRAVSAGYGRFFDTMM